MTLQDLIIRFALLFAVAAGTVLLLVPLVMVWGRRFGIVDVPSSRKVHTAVITRAGGLAFFPALLCAFAVILWWWPALWRERYLGLAIASLILVIAGIWDDVYGMKAPPKLFFQFLAGTALFSFGYRLQYLSLPFTTRVVELGALDFIITVVGIAAIVNCVNMIDGLDGLAAGSVFIMCTFLFLNRALDVGPESAVVLIIAMGIALAFLRFNFHPARVFMGDTGSMFLGVVLAAEILDSASQGAAVTAILVPLVILAIPVFDMLRIMLTRARAARHIFRADKNHLHHRLLDLGLSHREVVFLIYLLNVYMGLMALTYPHIEPAYRGLFVLSMAFFLFLAFYIVGIAGRDSAAGGAES